MDVADCPWLKTRRLCTANAAAREQIRVEAVEHRPVQRAELDLANARLDVVTDVALVRLPGAFGELPTNGGQPVVAQELRDGLPGRGYVGSLARHHTQLIHRSLRIGFRLEAAPLALPPLAVRRQREVDYEPPRAVRVLSRSSITSSHVATASFARRSRSSR